jgi:hypothetical protein
MYGSDSGGAGGWVLALLEMVVIVPVVVVVTVLAMAGRSVIWLARGGQQLIQRPPVQRELQRISLERNEAIRDVLRLRNQGERQLRAIADERGVEDWQR